MKNMFRFSALLCAMAVLVTSCTQDETLEPQVKPAADGSEILFGARAGFENAGESRTEYSGVDYTYGGKNYERIDWTSDTDQIEIYSPHTANSNNTYYQVKDANIKPDDAPTEGETTDHLHDYAYLQRMSDSGNLRWNGDGDHTFYAMYPSERMFDEPASEANGWVGTTVDMGIEMNKTVLTGVIPNSQVQTFDEEASDENTFVFKPDMRFAYMAAKTTTNRANGNVGLTFVPLVTAVEVELTFPDDGTNTKYHDFMVGEVEVTTMSNDTDTKTQPIAGPFTADLESWDGTSLPTVKIPDDGKFYNSIHLTTRKMNDAGTMSLPITLNEGKSLKFTVFLLPYQKIEDLCIKVSGTGAETYIGKTLTGRSIPAGLKTRIKKVKLPAIAESTTNPFQDASNWMADLKDEVTFRRLSLPGTGGSFSYNYVANDDRAEYAEQFAGMDLAAQWKLGIRAFEVIVNRPSSASTSLGSENVKCNKKSMGTTFNQVMTDLTNWVSKTYPNECAVVILTYQPEGMSPNRNGEAFAGSLYTWYNSFANKGILKKYTPDMTIKDARGHVMVLVRLNQKDEKENGGWFDLGSSIEYGIEHYNNAVTKLNDITDNPFVLINGAGTAKDRWGARGYKRVNADGTGTPYYFPHISNSYSGANIIESFMGSELYTTNDGQYTYSANASYDGTNYTISRPEAGNPDQLKFGFYTGNDNAQTVNATICWFQEWHRVVATPVTYNNHHWFESYYEKLDNAKTTYDMAVSGDEKYKNYIFVNSLCGYLAESGDGIVPSTGLTYGGSGGNYAGLAEKINPAFYQYVYQRSQENTQGPTGIVLMDYVTKDSSLPHYYLPGLIIANNRKTGNAK